MKSPPRLALLAALALAGCVSTQDEPFSLDDGDALAPAAHGYLCVSYDARGRRTDAGRRWRLVALRRDKRTQYAFVDDASASVEPLTLHQAKGRTYVVAVAHSDGPGENLFVAEFGNGAKEVRLYEDSDASEARAQAKARERGASLAHTQFSDDLSGPVEAQRAFMIELASDMQGRRMSVDCRALP